MRLYELEVIIYDGENCYTKSVQFRSSPASLRGEALSQFLNLFHVDPKSEAAESVAEQWFHDEGQITIPGDLRLFEIERLGEVAPIVICMDGSMICAVTQDGEEVPYVIEQIR